MTSLFDGTFDWSAVAPAWEETRESAGRGSSPVSEALVRGLAPRAGDRVLELGAGTGDLARRVAELVLPGGTVHATDAAQGMLDVTARVTADCPNVTTQLVDATRIPLPDASVDAVVFQMGLMFLREPAVAAREMRRVLVPGGRVAVATWGAPEQNPWITSLGMAAAVAGLVAGGLPTGPGGLFSLSSPEALRDVLVGAGFDGVQVDQVPVQMSYPSTTAYADQVSRLSGPLAAAIAAAPAETQQAVRTTAAQLVEQYATADGVSVPALALVATGRS
jgi:SAM-dependent methyltransferase